MAWEEALGGLVGGWRGTLQPPGLETGQLVSKRHGGHNGSGQLAAFGWHCGSHGTGGKSLPPT